MRRLSLLVVAVLSASGGGGICADRTDWDDVLFASRSAALAVAHPTLLRLADLLARNEDYRVRLEGHTDGQEALGAAAEKLARARGEAVRAYLIKHGVKDDQVEIATVIPAQAGGTPEVRFASRRVRLTLRDGTQDKVAADGRLGQSAILKALNAVLLRLDALEERQRELDDLLRHALSLLAEDPLAQTAPPPPAPPPPPLPAVRDPILRGRELLEKGEEEPAGYGAYSYVLFPEQALSNSDQEKRYLQVLEAYLLQLSDLTEIEDALKLEGRLDRKRLHRAAVPVTRQPDAMDARVVLGVYDFARASVMLNRLQLPSDGVIGQSGGPYLVCTLQPLTKVMPVQRLVQSLHWVPPGSLMQAWFKHFLDKAAQPQAWDSKSLNQFALETQTWLEVVSVKAGVTRAAMKETMAFFDLAWSIIGK
jgi:hypothetical protein